MSREEMASRKNGWDWPPSILQCLAWLSLVYLVLYIYGIMIPSFVVFIQYIAYSVSLLKSYNIYFLAFSFIRKLFLGNNVE